MALAGCTGMDVVSILKKMRVKFDDFNVVVEGDLTIKGKTNAITENGTIDVKGKTVKVQSKFNINLADYGITFAKGKPSTNIAKEVEVTVHSEYSAE